MSDSLEINKKTSSGLGVCILFSVVSVLLVAADQIIKSIIVKNVKFSGPELLLIISSTFTMRKIPEAPSRFLLIKHGAYTSCRVSRRFSV